MNENAYTNVIEDSLDVFLQSIERIVLHYNKFFNISDIFSSEDRGKIRLNRDTYNKAHLLIQKDIEAIELQLNSILEYLKEKKIVFLKEVNNLDYIDFNNLIFSDEIAIKNFHLDLQKIVLTDHKKRELEKELLYFIEAKNILSNLSYFVYLINTTFVNSIVSKLSLEELVNSTLIIEIIDSCGLQFQKLMQLENELKRKKFTQDIITNPQDLNDTLELLKRRCNGYEYNNIRYKVVLEYNNNIESTKSISINKNYFEQLLFSLIEHSCLDIIKKELKKGKIEKLIIVNVFFKKGVLTVLVQNSGFDTNDITVFDEVGKIENKFIFDVKNIARLLQCEFEIVTIPNEGMQYIIKLS
ncbi:MAG: hypothetical protein ACNI28_09770 [Arcobacter sp.]|uniref:hypothetical protein n=1 Tax=Arcobacter sp. TaxID=1872629 RepID=UPI003AFFE985